MGGGFWKVVSPDSRWDSGNLYPIYIYITKSVVLVSEPVRGRSRATELPCYKTNNISVDRNNLNYCCLIFMVSQIKISKVSGLSTTCTI